MVVSSPRLALPFQPRKWIRYVCMQGQPISGCHSLYHSREMGFVRHFCLPGPSFGGLDGLDGLGTTPGVVVACHAFDPDPHNSRALDPSISLDVPITVESLFEYNQANISHKIFERRRDAEEMPSLPSGYPF